MITKIKANKSFRGTTRYVLEKEKATIIGGNMYGRNTRELVEQFTLSAHLNPQLKDPCYHLMLSVPKTDRALSDEELASISERHFASVVVLSKLKGEEVLVKNPEKRISDTKLNKLVDEFIESELPAYDFFIARHSDKENDHTHIVASRVNNLDGKSIRAWNNYAHSEHSARLLEREFNLTQVPSSWESKRKAMTRNQLERVERDGLPGEEIMRRAIEKVALNKPTMPEFIQRLWSEHQIKAVVSYYSHGGIRGIKFGIDIGTGDWGLGTRYWENLKRDASQLNSNHMFFPSPQYPIPNTQSLDDGSPRLLWKQGGNLNKYKCSFKKLQSELGVSYDPIRDDIEIKQLTKMLESTPITRGNEKEIEVKTPSISTDNVSKIELDIEEKYRLSKEEAHSLYNHYGAKLPDLLVTDRDKETARRALADGRDEREVSEIIQASSVGWTKEEAKALVLIASDKMRSKSQTSSAEHSKKQDIQVELLAVAVPVSVEILNIQLRENGENSFRFKRATLEKQGREIVYTHDERGEIFRVAVNRNQSGIIEYSPISIGEVSDEDITTWHKVEELLRQHKEEIALSQQQSITIRRGRGR